MLPELTIFLDENHHRCKPILRVLAEAGVRVVCHYEHFQPGTPDEVWLPFVGEKGWVLLTADTRIRIRHSERTQVIQSNARLFYFASNNQPAIELAQSLHNALPKMADLVRTEVPPFFASIQKDGKIVLRRP